MSGYSGHLLFYMAASVVALAVSFWYYPIDIGVVGTLIAVTIGAGYALLPDVDIPSSKMRRIIGKVFLAVIIASLLIYLKTKTLRLVYIAIALSICLYILWFVKHRGLLHTPVVGVLFSAPLYFIEPWYAVFAFLGFMSHLVADGEVFS